MSNTPRRRTGAHRSGGWQWQLFRRSWYRVRPDDHGSRMPHWAGRSSTGETASTDL